MAKGKGTKLIAQNKKAYHDYFIEETIQAGISLAGTGLAVMACWEAMTAIPNGRSGRIFVSVATSAITGSTE